MKKVIKILKKLEKIKNSKELMLRGSLYKTKKKCGNKDCKICNSGKMHDAIHFTYFETGKNRMAYINKKIYQEVKKYWERYRKYHLLIMDLKKEIEIVFKDLNIYTKSYTISIDELRDSIKKVRKN
jgi:hypothetical protein